MNIIFRVSGELLTGEKVKAGETRDFPDKEAQAFIQNGVAEAVPVDTKKTK